ncbi:MAG: serine hydrolase, partial [Candidatus Poribacteria bacterium]
DEFMRNWLVLGPISIFKDDKDQTEELQKKAFVDDLLSQYGGESGIRPTSEMICKIGDKDLQWKVANSTDDKIDLIKLYGQKNYAIAYAYAEIDMPSEKKTLLGIGSDDAIKVWLNGKLIHENWIARAANKDDDLVPVDLQKGVNHLLLKIQNGTGAWGFICREMGKSGMNSKLISSASKGLLDDVELVLAYGADVNATDEIGLTALHRATMGGRKDIVDLLIKNGADPDIKMPDKETLADAFLNRVFKGDCPGASVLVAKDGKIIYQKGFGYADIGNRVPFTVDTKSRIGSHTKQFIASAILKLQEEGKISVNDKLSKFIPDFPRGDEVTIHHLLTHTSGIHSFTNKPEFDKYVTCETKTEDVINSIKKDPYDFNPGEKQAYNNSGYFILGYIIEKITGEPYGDYLKKNFFDPLGMKNTGVHDSHTIYENEAYGYSYEDGKFVKATNWNMSQAGGAGSLYSTVGDLFLWNEGIFNGKVLNEESLKSALTPVKLNDGTEAKALGGGYGYGWLIMENRGLKLITHGGGLAGFNSGLIRYPDINATIVVLQNCWPPAPGMAAFALALPIQEIFFWEYMKPQESVKVDKTVNADKYDDYVGRYDYNGVVMTIRRDGNRLFAQLAGQPEFEIFPKSENEFFWKVVDAQATFVRDESGKVTHILHYQSGNIIKAPKLKEETPVNVDPKILDTYVGEYDLMGTPTMITREDNHLYIQVTGQPKVELFPRSETEFFLKVAVADLKFIKDNNGKVTKAILNQTGMTIELKKVK